MSNRYESMYSCIDRLYDEYLKHNNLIIAVDFDDTVFDFHDIGSTYEYIFSILKEAQEQGHIIVMFSACKKERFSFIEQYMKDRGINVASINQNPFPMEYGNDGKIFYNILLDDKAGLGQALEILKQTMQRIKKSNDF